MEVREASAAYLTQKGSFCPPGYKQTEVGVIPKDWEVKPLVDLAKVRSGMAKNSNKTVNSPTLVHYLRVANVQDGYLDLSEMSMIELNRDEITRYTVLPGDVLMNEGGDLDKLGRGSLWHGEFVPCVHQNHVFVVRCRSPLSPDYLNVWTGAAPARRYFLVAGKQTTNLASINKTALGLLPVALPPTKAEQEAIAGALSDADGLIESLEQLIAKKRHLQQGAMQELLTGKKRLPGFGQSGQYHDTTKFGMVPEEWLTTTLERIAAFITKGSTPTTYGFAWQKEGILFLRSECVAEIGLDLSQSMFISDKAHRALQRSEVNSGDILMTITGNVGRVVHLKSDFGEANINQHIARVRIVDKQVVDEFVFHFLSQPLVRRYYNLITTGQAYPQISLTQVRKTEIHMPSLPEQTAIAAILSDMDAEIAALDEKLAKARRVKQGMMQELLTGRIRLV